ncbi:MAG TPA: PKD domain-containing protein, partial [Nitrosomonas nitrosa]|nr:PKD domain-containing protein [Nitrosomonas nitrosa]
ATFSITVLTDTVDETDESVVVELYNPENAIFPDGVNTLQAIGVIHDDDGAGNNLGLFVGNVEIVEGADGVTREVAVPIHLSRPSDQTLTFEYQTTDDSAIAGQDYTAQTGTVTFLPGQTSAAAIIPIIGDAIDEPNETFSLTVTPTAEIANGSAGATGTITILEGDALPPPAGITVGAGNDETINEGSLFTRTITFIDDADTNTDGWTYSIDWGDGSANETGSIAAGASAFDISRFYADGNAGYTVSVTVTDVLGDSDTQQFNLNVNNVMPSIALAGPEAINMGDSYTLNLGAITDPGLDTVTSYIVNWGDGTVDTFSSAGDVTHIYSAAGNSIITVDLVDEDGTHMNAGNLTVQVNTPPEGVSLDAGSNSSLNEGSFFNRTILFSDGEDANSDGWTYSVDWGDGSAAENGVIAAGINNFNISRFFADGDASHTVSVTVTDTAGDTDTQQFVLDVSNVAPAIALAGASTANTGDNYTLNLGAVVDPGDDTVTSYIVNWGDGTSDTFNTIGDVNHTYAAEGDYTISVDLIDEDDTYISVATQLVAVTMPTSNTPPVAVDDNYAVHANETLIVSAAGGLLANDTDADGDALSVVSFAAPSNGTLNVAADGSFTYNPNTGFVGSET